MMNVYRTMCNKAKLMRKKNPQPRELGLRIHVFFKKIDKGDTLVVQKVVETLDY